MKKQTAVRIFLAVTMISSSFAFGEENYQTRSGARADVSVSRTDITRSEVARRQQLLQQTTKLLTESEKLRAQYALTLNAIPQVKQSLAAAKAKCETTCTKAEVRDLTENIQHFSAIAVTTVFAANALRTIGSLLVAADGGPDETVENQFKRGGHSVVRPWKTVAGRLMLATGSAYVISRLVNDYIDTKDSVTRNEIERLEKELGNYQAQLTTINQNIAQNNAQLNGINAALKQTIRIKQMQVIQSESRVGYDQ